MVLSETYLWKTFLGMLPNAFSDRLDRTLEIQKREIDAIDGLDGLIDYLIDQECLLDLPARTKDCLSQKVVSCIVEESNMLSGGHPSSVVDVVSEEMNNRLSGRKVTALMSIMALGVGCGTIESINRPSSNVADGLTVKDLRTLYLLVSINELSEAETDLPLLKEAWVSVFVHLVQNNETVKLVGFLNEEIEKVGDDHPIFETGNILKLLGLDDKLAGLAKAFAASRASSIPDLS